MKQKKRKGPKPGRIRESRDIIGTLAKNRRGFGFVIPDDKRESGEADIYVARTDMGAALHGEKVTVRVTGNRTDGRGAEGCVVAVHGEEDPTVIGTYQEEDGRALVRPEKHPWAEAIDVAAGSMEAAPGDKVAVRVVKRPSAGRERPSGALTRLIAPAGQPRGETDALIEAFAVRSRFPKPTLAAAEKLPLEPAEEEREGRKDYRGLTTFTIDGSDARDFDDAVSIDPISGGYRLYTHIADVSHYVPAGGELDREAFARGTSVYLPDRVLPMLPERLSNHLCSLNPGVDRLAVTVRMDIDDTGRVMEYAIEKSVIRSDFRLVYTDVSDILEQGNPALSERYREILPALERMGDLAKTLESRRRRRGGLDFDLREAAITVDEEGSPVRVEAAERRTANRLIEEFMLLTNETVAEHAFHLNLPFIYRVHERPAADAIAELKTFLKTMGFEIKGRPEEVTAGALNAVLGQAAKTPEAVVVQTIVLQAMKKALYLPECLGHFGLGARWYCHFTSPIRRYPDLMIHRMLFDRGGKDAANRQRVAEAAEQASRTERQAEELEREVEKSVKARYMQAYIGQTFRGVISGVGRSGFFVQLENTIEGMVRMDQLDDDYYIYEPEKHRLIGERRHRIFCLGGSATVTVVDADPFMRAITFALAEG